MTRIVLQQLMTILSPICHSDDAARWRRCRSSSGPVFINARKVFLWVKLAESLHIFISEYVRILRFPPRVYYEYFDKSASPRGARAAACDTPALNYELA